MKYTVIIPTYNHCDDLLKPCIDSIFKYTNIYDIELIISANGCKDNTFQYLETLNKKYKKINLENNLKIVWNEDPLGYSKACNVAITEASTDLIVLLNNDVLLLEQEKNSWLELLENPFKTNDKCGISCVIKGPSEPAGRDFAVFFCVMIHKKVFDKLGLLSLDYGVGGGEDTEFSIECENAGFEVVECLKNQWDNDSSLFVGSFPIYHKGEGTLHDKNLVPEWNKIFHENSLTLAKKYNRQWYKWAISNHSERGVFFKGDTVFPREKFRYEFASKNLIGTKILEIGCSSGFGVQFLPDNIEYTGIDYDKEIIEAAKNQNWKQNLKFIQADINNFDLEFYDTIIAFETIEHLENGFQVLEKLKNKCKKLIISVPYNENPNQFSPHHRLHNLTPDKFENFKTIGLIDINGNLLEHYNIDNNIEYNLLLLYEIKNEKMNYKEKLKFLSDQHEEIYKELIVDNIYNVNENIIKNKYVIDIGANIGVFSLFAAELGAKQVFSIEPVSETFFSLCKNINHVNYKNIFPLKNVVSNKPNELVKISLNPNHGHNSMYNVVEKHEIVTSITLSQLLSNCIGDDIIMKVDCEGAEYDILLNATKEEMDRVDRILLEVHSELHPIYKGFEILNEKLKSFGFTLEDMKQVYTWQINERGEQVNWQTIPYRVEIWKK